MYIVYLDLFSIRKRVESSEKVRDNMKSRHCLFSDTESEIYMAQ